MTQDQIKEVTRLYLESFLPDALSRALISYQEFSNNQQDDFKEHHSACKIAISHIELLLKLVKWAEIPIESNQEKARANQLSEMVAEAQRHLNKYNKK